MLGTKVDAVQLKYPLAVDIEAAFAAAITCILKPFVFHTLDEHLCAVIKGAIYQWLKTQGIAVNLDWILVEQPDEELAQVYIQAWLSRAVLYRADFVYSPKTGEVVTTLPDYERFGGPRMIAGSWPEHVAPSSFGIEFPGTDSTNPGSGPRIV